MSDAGESGLPALLGRLSLLAVGLGREPLVARRCAQLPLTEGDEIGGRVGVQHFEPPVRMALGVAIR